MVYTFSSSVGLTVGKFSCGSTLTSKHLSIMFIYTTGLVVSATSPNVLAVILLAAFFSSVPSYFAGMWSILAIAGGQII